jgi:5-carboxymethyl-2-hydroxymuconic-semialdehyde dehydrogenase
MIKHWINGREVESKQVFETVNPATGEVITEVASGGADEINAAVAAAEAFPSGRAPRPRSAPRSCAVWAS